MFILFLCLIFSSFNLNAQSPLPSNPFYDKEEINYDFYFKWGILMPKAALAKATVSKSTFNDKPVWHYKLLLNSIGLVDKAFRMRDTIDSYFTIEPLPKIVYAEKNSMEGGYYQMDKLTFWSTEDNKQVVHSFRRNVNRIRVDTIMSSERIVYDILGSLTFIRTIDWTNLNIGDEGFFNCVMGRDMINVVYRYDGQQIIERGNVKYKTRKFVLDIFDDSFTDSKEAAEIWIGDDDNHVPIRIRAKLKIGAAEVYYNSSSNLRYPLNCRIEVSKRYASNEDAVFFDQAFYQQ